METNSICVVEFYDSFLEDIYYKGNILSPTGELYKEIKTKYYEFEDSPLNKKGNIKCFSKFLLKMLPCCSELYISIDGRWYMAKTLSRKKEYERRWF